MKNKSKSVMKLLIDDLSFLDKKKIKFVLIRNYFKEISAHDIDLIVKKSHFKKLKVLLEKKGYKIFETYFHKVYAHKLSTKEQFILHIHLNAYEAPYSSFLNIENLLLHSSKVKDINVLSPSQICALYLYKIKTGRPLEKAKKYLLANIDLSRDVEIKIELLKVFEESSVDKSLKSFRKKNFSRAGKILNFNNSLFELNRDFFKLLHKIETLKKIFKPSEFIVFIGTDGSGKTTTTQNFVEYFRNKGLIIDYEYGGRFKFKYLPLNWLVSKTADVKKKQGQKQDTIKYDSNFVYVAAPFVYYCEYLLRYLFSTFAKRRRNHYVFADRSYIDVITSANASQKTARFLYKYLLPKPSKVFFLYNDAKVLSSRRPEHDSNDIKRQLKAFHKNKDLYFATIKTNTKEETFDDILKKLF